MKLVNSTSLTTTATSPTRSQMYIHRPFHTILKIASLAQITKHSSRLINRGRPSTQAPSGHRLETLEFQTNKRKSLYSGVRSASGLEALHQKNSSQSHLACYWSIHHSIGKRGRWLVFSNFQSTHKKKIWLLHSKLLMRNVSYHHARGRIIINCRAG